MEQRSQHEELALELAGRFQTFDTVAAIALGGSLAATAGDAHSDIDLYVYSSAVIPLAAREALVAERGASRADLNLQFWDLGDEWYDAPTGIEVDIVYWPPAWIEEQLVRVWRDHQPSMGYSTCFWNTVRQSRLLFDRDGWFAALQARSQQPYPEPLRLAIIEKNHAVLRRVIPGYTHQIEKAIRRQDRVSLNHRIAALLASYFDVLFALNRVLHPGEKRLIPWTLAHCERLPVDFAAQVEAVLCAAHIVEPSLAGQVHALLDGLDELLRQEGFDPATSLPAAVASKEG